MQDSELEREHTTQTETDYQVLYQKSQEDLARTTALYQILQTAMQASSLDEALQYLVEQAVALLKAHAVWLAIVNQTKRRLRNFVKAGPGADQFDIDTYTEINHGSTGRVLQQEKLLIHNETLIVVPLLHDVAPHGVFVALNRPREAAFTTAHMEIMQALSKQVSLITAGYAHMHQRIEHLEQQKKSIVEASQQKDEFLLNTSHELRTPLNGIIGIAESMMDGATGRVTEAQRYNLSMIASGGRRLANLVNDILDFSRLQRQDLDLDIKPIDLRQLTDTVIHLSKPLVSNHSLQLRNRVPADLPPAAADENRLQQVLHNLIDNAIKFSNEGEIRVKARLIKENNLPPQFITENNKQPLLLITVSDTGVGIPNTKLELIFQSFEQANSPLNRAASGLGLGLAITKKLIELHGGHIWAESTAEEGTQFKFTLPISKQAVTPHTPTNSSRWQRKLSPTSPENNTFPEPLETDPSEQGFQVLVVDDEEMNRLLLKNYLTMHDFSVIEAANGFEAMEALAKTKPDIVLLDVMMPRMSGYEVCFKMRQFKQAHELPIVLLTAKNQVVDLLAGFEVGANDYITKPFDRDELLARIKTHLRLTKISTAYGRFVPYEFLRLLNHESIVEVALGDHVQKEMTVLFLDVRSFTTLSEQMTPKENFDFINSLMSDVGPLIRDYNGFIDKYIGDAIMALFPESADDAVRAAIAMLKQLAHFNYLRQANGKDAIRLGIGLHTGSLILGTVGEEQRMDTTVISNAVNLASRIEGLTKRYGCNLLISEQTYCQLTNPEQYQIRFVDKVRVKGKEIAVAVYEVFDGDVEAVCQLKQNTKLDFEEGVQHYYAQEFELARQRFETVLAHNPHDVAAQLYQQRATEYAAQGVPSDWEGVERLTEK